MKFIKYITVTLLFGLAVMSCEKHEILYDTIPVDSSMAEFQLHYFEPITNVAANYIDSVFVNDVLYSSVSGSGQLVPYNGVPGGATNKFFAAKAGTTNLKFYRKGNVVYDYNIELKTGRQNIFVHDMTKAPIILDNDFPYVNFNKGATVANWDTDSIATVKFYNFLYEDANTPYPGKIQYQYQEYRTEEWKNLGNPVGFGEATERVEIVIVKTVHNSSGYRRVDYRMLDEDGNILKVRNSSGSMVNYGDYWTGYIGRAYMHIFGGIRTGTPVSSVRQWTSL